MLPRNGRFWNRGQCEGNAAGSLILTDINKDLLRELWPEDKVIAGRRVCRFLRRELLKVKSLVIRASTLPSHSSSWSILPKYEGSIEFYGMRLGGIVDSLIVPAVIEGWKGPSVLNLVDSHIKREGAESLSQALARCGGTIKRLELDGNYVGRMGISRLSVALTHCRNLTFLSLGRNLIGDKGIGHLVSSLLFCPLQHLDLSINYIGAEGAAKLASVLPHLSMLEVLILFGNPLKDEGVEKISKVLLQCFLLQRLDLSVNGIGAEGAGRLALALPSCTRLRSLNLRGNALGDLGVKLLSWATPQCLAMTELDLSRNSITADGASSLCRKLVPDVIVNLDLAGNFLGEEGAMALALSLKSCTSLSRLELSRCRLGCQGIKRLIPLRHNQSLSHLGLGLNDIGDSGVEALLPCLSDMHCLKWLDLCGNGITDQGASLLCSQFTSLLSLETLNLGGNNFSLAGVDKLRKAAKEARSLRTLIIGSEGNWDEGSGLLSVALPCGILRW
ncbi:hypothetical protein GUITHDRAFT_136783 [Guillardia theta CCMP2712]|uniref:Uncharacterized protein n=1 Tax=Guillardia theta (strain CCMP2712) TaxID=905079 RepID=L1JJL5_GUITC|nr:hypothetical protein GUITHDRAFT_136783 [Guillardia theta CCMP2712]EKX48265.1 hypothetical protein GUITHDRAFT_136783 [Guillardia theta CCMP2712]|eukprot:XP_005835245.1 hypothetical protein GUITHDRAFT_136783 [Guillardia theta CCMP2712]